MIGFDRFVWTETRIAILKRLWSTELTSKEIAEQLGQGATSEGVRTKRRQLGLPARQRHTPSGKPRKAHTRRSAFWTDERLAEAKRLFADEGKTAEETAEIIGCGEGGIRSLARRRGWKRNPEHVRANLARNLRNLRNQGASREPRDLQPVASADGRKIYLVPKRAAPKHAARRAGLPQRKRRFVQWFLDADWAPAEVAELFDCRPEDIAA